MDLHCTSLRQGLQLFPVLSQALHLQKTNAFGAILQMHFSHASTMRNTARFWDSLLQLASAVLVISHIMVDACSSRCSAKKYYLEVQKMFSMALIKQIKHIQAGNSMCIPVQRTYNVY